MYDELSEAIRDKRAILFVGSGASAGLDTPTWAGLIGEIGKQLGYDEDIFMSLGANYLTVAEYYKIKMGGIGPLRSWMDTNWAVPDSKLRASNVHELICELNFPIIYTTNYDRNIENSYKMRGLSHQKISNIRHLSSASSGTEIVKLHGDFDDDNSLVVTESDYFSRLSFESPLDIKLRSDVIGKSILFIGYSLSDINVRLLLYKLWKMWLESGHHADQPKSYIFLTRPDEIQTSVLRQWGVHTITAEVDDPGESLCSFLSDLLADVRRISP